MLNKKRVVSVYLFLLLCVGCLFSEIFADDEIGVTIDFPQGFGIQASEGHTSYQFAHSFSSVRALLRVYDAGRFSSPSEASTKSAGMLGGKSESSSFEWRGVPSSLGSFSAAVQGELCSGWIFSAELPDKKGTLIFIVYDNEKTAPSMQSFMFSIIDAVCIDRGSFFEAGPVTAYAFSSEGSTPVTLHIGGKKISTSFDASDFEADTFVVEREFSIAVMYAQTDQRVDAWLRYYRQVYRAAYRRLERAAFDIYNELQPADDAAVLKTLLQWVQSFEYIRNFNTSDFTAVTSAASGHPSDCDSRSMLLAVLLSLMNYKTAFFVSHLYGHALVGIDLPLKGARIEHDGTSYLLCETTAPVDPGLVAKDMSDSAKWIFVPVFSRF